MAEIPGHIPKDQAYSKTGCGAGTPNACFSLTVGPESRGEFQCALIVAQAVAGMAGINLGWRVNEDEADGKAWCPLGVLGNSKKATA